MRQGDTQTLATRMAQIQARYLIAKATQLSPETATRMATSLVHDCLHHLDQQTLAIRFALDFHPTAARWSAWSSWAVALDETLPAACSSDLVTEQIQLLNCRSQVARELGDPRMAQQLALQALQLAEAQQLAGLSGMALIHLGVVAFGQDDLPAAQAYWQRAYALGAAHLPPVQLGHISMNLGTVAVQRGQTTVAQQQFSQALQHYSDANDEFNIAKVNCNIAALRNQQQTLTEIPAEVIAARAVFKRIDARYDYGLAENDVGYIALTLGQFEQAEAAFQAALEAFKQIGSLGKYALVLSNLAELYVTTGDWERATRTLDEARTLAGVCQKPLLVTAIDVDQGRMFAAQGRLVAAREVWTRALETQRAKEAWRMAAHTDQLLKSLPDTDSSLEMQIGAQQ